MTETQKPFRRTWKKFIGWTSMLLVAAVGVMVLMANLRLQAIQQQSAATEATLAATIVDRETQIAILQNALNRTTSDLSSRESLVARLNLLIGQLKEASGIAEKAGLVLLTLADQNSVAFKVSQSTLSPDQREKLAENLVLIKYARTFPAFEIHITGHTDDTWEGKADHSDSSRKKNHDLSLKRAEAVKQFLVDHQIPANKIQAEGRGMLWPVGVTGEADEATITERNKNDSARQANRRVEVLIKGVDLNVPTPQDAEQSRKQSSPEQQVTAGAPSSYRHEESTR
jgi:outer membrane protein OmpA-like peptidoglycan-associated protein